jgi:hypothetical protein
VAREWVQLRKLELHQEDQVDLRVAWQELELVRTLAYDFIGMDTGMGWGTKQATWTRTQKTQT